MAAPGKRKVRKRDLHRRISEDKGFLQVGLAVGSNRQHQIPLMRSIGNRAIQSHMFLQYLNAEEPRIPVQYLR